MTRTLRQIWRRLRRKPAPNVTITWLSRAMTDIVTRLRAAEQEALHWDYNINPPIIDWSILFQEAADHIEKLRDTLVRSTSPRGR